MKRGLSPGNRPIPSDSPDEAVGIVCTPHTTEAQRSRLAEALCHKFGAVPMTVAPAIARQGVLAVRFPSSLPPVMQHRMVRLVRRLSVVAFAGPLTHLSSGAYSLVDDRLIVQFKPQLCASQRQAFLAYYDLALTGNDWSPGALHCCRVTTALHGDVIDICNAMQATDMVLLAEPVRIIGGEGAELRALTLCGDGEATGPVSEPLCAPDTLSAVGALIRAAGLNDDASIFIPPGAGMIVVSREYTAAAGTTSHGAGNVFDRTFAHLTTFGRSGRGTALFLSAAADMPAIARVISARPDLSWVELRELLCAHAGAGDPEKAAWAMIDGRASAAQEWRGAIDIRAALASARGYSHDQRDLMVRNHSMDSGTVATDINRFPIDSPDIWVRNADPAAESLAEAVPATADDPGPHQKPCRSADRWIYCRIRNRGTVHASLPAWLRIYIAVCDGEPDFLFPQMWVGHGDSGEIRDGHANLYLLEEQPLFDTTWKAPYEAAPMPSIPAGATYVTRVRWNRDDLPAIPLPFMTLQTTRPLAFGDTAVHCRNTARLRPGQTVLLDHPSRCAVVQRVDDATSFTLTAPLGPGETVDAGRPVIPLSSVVTTVCRGTPVGATGVLVDDAMPLCANQWVLIGRPGTHRCQICRINAIDRGTTRSSRLLLDQALRVAVSAGDPVTLISDPVRLYAVAQVTPCDGTLAGEYFWNNSNITYKELNVLHDVRFTDASGLAALPGHVVVRPGADAVSMPFCIVVADCEQFVVDAVTIEFLREPADDKPAQRVVCRCGRKGWYQEGNQDWLHIDPPGDDDGAPVRGPVERALFKGSFQADADGNRLIMTVTVPGQCGALLFNTVRRHEVHFFTPPAVSASFGLVRPQESRLSLFTDMRCVDRQQAADAFGPDPVVPVTRFQVTSRFAATAAAQKSGTPVPAYAVATGTVALQRDGSADRVNLLLFPTGRLRSDSTPVLCFVYRGLRLSDFLAGADAPGERLVRSPDADASTFIQSVWRAHERLQAGVAGSALQISSRLLGWDPELSAPESMLLESLLDRGDTISLPHVPQGMHLGNFFSAGGYRFGFEIILASDIWSPPLVWARLSCGAVECDPGAADMKNRRCREAVAAFVDPAAWYGMHIDTGVEHCGNRLAGEQLYTEVLQKFHTSGRLYIDIRNEDGESLDFNRRLPQSGSTGDADADMSLTLGFVPDALTPQCYGVNGWPLSILDRSGCSNQEAGRLCLQLQADANRKALVYVESGDLVSHSVNDCFVGDTDLFDALAPQSDRWTRVLEFCVPHFVRSASHETVPVAGVIRLRRLLRLDPDAVAPVPALPRRCCTDALFGPLESVPQTERSGQRSSMFRGFVYIDGFAVTGVQAGFLACRSIMRDQDQVLFSCRAVNFYPPCACGGGIVQEHHEPSRVSRSVVDRLARITGVHPVTRRLLIAQPGQDAVHAVTAISLQAGGNPHGCGPVLMLGITAAELDRLCGIGGFSHDHARTISLIPLPGPDGTPEWLDATGVSFFCYRLSVWGRDPAGSFRQAPPPDCDSGVSVYSLDNRCFVSAGFGQACQAGQDPREDFEALAVRTLTGATCSLQVATGLAALSDSFAAGVNRVPADARARRELLRLAGSAAAALWREGCRHAAQAYDDRPLYIARMRMLHALGNHPLCQMSTLDREEMATLFRHGATGLKDGTVFEAQPGVRRVVLIAFDPDIWMSEMPSPAASVALSLHGRTVQQNAARAVIHTIILPRRFSAISEDSLAAAFQAPFESGVCDMVLCVADQARAASCEIKRFAVNRRGPVRDNGNQLAAGVVDARRDAPALLQTTLPVRRFVRGPFGDPAAQWAIYDQSLVTDVLAKKHPLLGGPNRNTDDGALPAACGIPHTGSGGNGLENELFYRLCRLAAGCNDAVQVGMVGVPRPDPAQPLISTLSGVAARFEQILKDGIE